MKDEIKGGNVGAARFLDGLRGQRYGEVLLVYDSLPVHVEVYNSFSLNDCPDELWQRLDPVMIAREYGASLAILNGPRYWMIDAVAKINVTEAIVRDFGGIEMRRVATIETDGPLVPRYYSERRVQRGAEFFFDAGRDIFELVSDDGRRYVLQAYCVSVDASITPATLSSLGEKLHLPSGWVFQRRVLDQELSVDTTHHEATVLQDELQNTYSLVS